MRFTGALSQQALDAMLARHRKKNVKTGRNGMCRVTIGPWRCIDVIGSVDIVEKRSRKVARLNRRR